MFQPLIQVLPILFQTLAAAAVGSVLALSAGEVLIRMVPTETKAQAAEWTPPKRGSSSGTLSGGRR